MKSAQSLPGPGVRLPSGRGPVVDDGDAQPSRLPAEDHAGARGAGVAGGVGQGLGHDPGSGLRRQSRETIGHRSGLGSARICADVRIGVEIDGDAGAAGPADQLPKALGETVDGAGAGCRCVSRRDRCQRPGRRGPVLVAQDGEHAPQRVSGLAGSGLNVVECGSQPVGGGLESPGHGAAHGDGAEVAGDGVVQLAGNDEAVLGDGARGGLLGQAPFVGTPVAPPQPQGGGDEPGHDEQHRHLGAPRRIRGVADQGAQAKNNHGQPGDGAPERRVARWDVWDWHAASLGRRLGRFIEPGSDGPGSEAAGPPRLGGRCALPLGALELAHDRY